MSRTSRFILGFVMMASMTAAQIVPTLHKPAGGDTVTTAKPVFSWSANGFAPAYTYDFESDAQGWAATSGSGEKGFSIPPAPAAGTDQVFEGSQALKCHLTLTQGSADFGQGYLRVELPAAEDFTGRDLKFRLWFPGGLVDSGAPNGIQIALWDQGWNYCDSGWQNISVSNSWVTYSVNFPTDNNFVAGGFDLTQVRRVGIKVAAGGGNGEKFDGFIYVDGVSLSGASGLGVTAYQIQVDSESGFPSPVLERTNITFTNFTPVSSIGTNGTWYWRVRAKTNDRAWNTWTAAENFVVNVPAASVIIPTLRSPVSVQVLTNRPMFSWSGEGLLPVYDSDFEDGTVQGWVPEDWSGQASFNQAPAPVNSTEQSFEGSRSLKCHLVLTQGHATLNAGAMWLDFGAGGLDLSAPMTVKVRVRLPSGLVNGSNPNGFQFVVKDTAWTYCNTTWQNIDTGDAWVTYTARFPDDISYDAGADFSSVRRIGFQITGNAGSGSTIDDYIFIDAFTYTGQDVSYVSNYQLQVASESGFVSPLVDTNLTATNFRTVTALTEGTWFWRVRTYGVDGWNPWASAKSFLFSTLVDVSGPGFSLVTPVISAKQGETVLAVWTSATDSGAGFDRFEAVLPGGAITNLSASTDYSLTVASAGVSLLKIRAYDAAGNMTEKVIRINVIEDLESGKIKVFPNPVRKGGSATLQYGLEDGSVPEEAVVEVFDAAGHPVFSKTLDDPASGSFVWGLENDSSRDIAPGLYLFRVTVKYESGKRKVSAFRKFAVVK
jgi:hypothetical protein